MLSLRGSASTVQRPAVAQASSAAAGQVLDTRPTVPALPPLEQLGRGLAASLLRLRSQARDLGDPEALCGAVGETRRLFGARPGEVGPPSEDARTAARALLRGEPLDAWQSHQLSGVLAVPVDEEGGQRPLGSPHLEPWLHALAGLAREGRLWLLTWHGLMGSYFAFDPLVANAAEREGWRRLQALLTETWPALDALVGKDWVPDWVRALRTHPDLLEAHAGRGFAAAFVAGETGPIRQVAEELGIVASSWFWHRLVRQAVALACAQDDATLERLLPRLLQLLDRHAGERDEALLALLRRHARPGGRPMVRALRDHLVRPDVWRSPELRSAGVASAWDRVDEPIWRMVLDWANEGNLQDFFDLLVMRPVGHPEDERRAFWQAYRGQIRWTRLVFSADTTARGRREEGIRAMLDRDEGSFATFWQARDVDALLMQIGEHLIVEFSPRGAPAALYDMRRLRFDPHALRDQHTPGQVRYGFQGAGGLRLARQPGWQAGTRAALARLGIHPDLRQAA